jgi:sugar phosphate isomerase/epimerase
MPDNGMSFAYATAAVPGDSLTEKCALIASTGCKGFEPLIFADSKFETWQNEIRIAASNHDLKPVVVVLGNLALYRPGEMSWVREALQAIAELGAAALLTPEYRAQDPIPLFPPHPMPSRDEQRQVTQSLNEVSQIASSLKMDILFEPVNEYMSRFWHRVDIPLSICKQINKPNIGLALDFNIMNVTESSIPASIQTAGKWVRHVHLADNNRRLPGQGHIEFPSGINALEKINYSGWFSFESVASCEERFEEETKEAIQYIERLWLHKMED